MHVPSIANNLTIRQQRLAAIGWRCFGHGNRCGHDPRQPIIPIITDPLPDTIQAVIGHIQQYYDRPESIPALRAVIAQGLRRRGMRSEARESCAIVLAWMLGKMDVVTRRVGIRNLDGSVTGYDAYYIARQTKLSHSRVCRALRLLRLAGIYVSHRRAIRDPETGDYRARAAIRQVTTAFFRSIGFCKKLARCAKIANKRRRRSEVEASLAITEMLAAQMLRVPARRASAIQAPVERSGPHQVSAHVAALRAALKIRDTS